MRIGLIDARGQAIFDDALNTAATPSISFNGDTDTGLYRSAADTIGISTGGTERVSISTTAVTSTLPIVHPTGTAVAPSVTFTGDLDSGVYSGGADQICVSAGGAEVICFDTTGITAASGVDITLSGGGELLGLPAIPSGATAAASKSYVDSLAAGLDPKESVRVATTAALPANTQNGSGVGATLTMDAVGVVTIDGEDITAANGFAVGDRILVKNEADATHNGIYTVSVLSDGTTALELTRAADQDGSPSNEVSGGNFTFVEEGTTNADSGWVVIGDGQLTVETDNINWVQFSGAGSFTAGAGLAQSGSTIFLDTGDLTDTAITTTDEITFHDVSVVDSGVDNGSRKRLVSDFLSDLDIVNSLGGNGIAVQTAAGTYANRSIAVSGPGNEDGLTVTNGDGVAGNPTIGLDIVGNALAGEDVATGDLFLLYNVSATANQTFTLAEVAAGVSTELSIDNTLLVDADGDTRVEVEENADEDIIRFDVGDTGGVARQDIVTISNTAIQIGHTTALGTPLAGHSTTVQGGVGGLLGGDGGAVTVSGGNSVAASGGDVSVIGGDGNTSSGSVTISTGSNTATSGTAGTITISTPSNGLAGVDTGAISISTGNKTAEGNAGSINITTGDGNGTGVGGAINLTAGAGGGNDGGAVGGDVVITAGAGNNADAGDLVLAGGFSSSTGAGGNVDISGGNSSGVGGSINLTAGSSGAADGGDINLTPGNASSNKGSVNLLPIGTDSGDTTELRFFELVASGNNYVGFKAPDAITSNVIWTLPNSDSTGTQALVSNGAGVLSWSSLDSAVLLSDADSDTQIQVEENADEDIIRFDVGDSPAGYGAVADIMTLASSGWTASMGTADTAATAGAPISFTAGTGNTTGAGGAINLTAGVGGTDGDGGAVVITAGDAGGGDESGGDIELRPGAGDGTGENGVVRIIGPTTGSSGAIRLEDNTGGEFVGLQAPATITTSFTLTLPADDGDAGQFLRTDGSGVLTWETASSLAFTTITPDSGGDIVADTNSDTLTLVGGTGIDTVGTPGSDTITFNVNINSLTALGVAPATGDEIAIADVDDSNNVKKVTVAQLASAIQGATTLGDLNDVDTTAEAAGFALVFDATASTWEAKKIFHTEAFTSSTQWVVTHNLNQQYPVITVYDDNDEVVIPATIIANSATQVTINFAVATAGQVSIMGVNQD